MKNKGEKQYQKAIQDIKNKGNAKLGLMTSWAYYDDPKRLVFTFARYKFVSKMVNGFNRVLEIGCSDGFASRIVAQSVENLVAIDFDKDFIDDAISRNDNKYNIEFKEHDILETPINDSFDGIYALDVLEHIEKKDEDKFISNSICSLLHNGTYIIGMPSIQSQVYASPQSKEGHVNCKTQDELYKLMLKYFYNVYIFSMNDEVVHTGFHAMSHYNIALCCYKK